MTAPVAFRRRDLLWLLLPAVCVAVLLLRGQTSAAATAEISVDGTVIATLPLTEAQTFTPPEVSGITLCIADGSIRMTAADCPDRRCVHMGSISQPGEMLVCLPNRLIVRIVSSEAAPADVVIG